MLNYYYNAIDKVTLFDIEVFIRVIERVTCRMIWNTANSCLCVLWPIQSLLYVV